MFTSPFFKESQIKNSWLFGQDKLENLKAELMWRNVRNYSLDSKAQKVSSNLSFNLNTTLEQKSSASREEDCVWNLRDKEQTGHLTENIRPAHFSTKKHQIW